MHSNEEQFRKLLIAQIQENDYMIKIFLGDDSAMPIEKLRCLSIIQLKEHLDRQVARLEFIDNKDSPTTIN